MLLDRPFLQSDEWGVVSIWILLTLRFALAFRPRFSPRPTC